LNIIFWLLVASMILIALLFVVMPLIKKREGIITDESSERNVQIARERLAELKANQASGGISQAQYDEQVAELELSLSDDLDAEDTGKTPLTAAPQGRWLAYALIIFIPLLAIGLYGGLGDYQAIGRVNDPAQSESAAGSPEMPSPEVINKMVEKLANKLKSEPDNLEGWLMLGKSYKVLQRNNEAVKAYERAYQLAGDKADVMLPYAESVALAGGGDWRGKPMELVNKALTLEPENVTGLWFAAMGHAQQDDKAGSLAYLRKLLTVLPENSQDKQQIQTLIAGIEGQQNGDAKPSSENKNQAPEILAAISLAPELKSKVKPESTVFIYAQALSGPKMPLAIVRKRVADLPLTVTLSDTDGMLPSVKLSDFKQVKLLARVSSSGSAMPQPGDLLGVLETVETGTKEKQKISINQEIK
jgi:cytochrome c-type biogenesis protein CcmH